MLLSSGGGSDGEGVGRVVFGRGLRDDWRRGEMRGGWRAPWVGRSAPDRPIPILPLKSPLKKGAFFH